MEQSIHVDRDILEGTPVFSGTRVPVKNLFDYLEDGDTIDGLLDDFPSVKKEQVNVVLQLVPNLINS